MKSEKKLAIYNQIMGKSAGQNEATAADGGNARAQPGPAAGGVVLL